MASIHSILTEWVAAWWGLVWISSSRPGQVAVVHCRPAVDVDCNRDSNSQAGGRVGERGIHPSWRRKRSDKMPGTKRRSHEPSSRFLRSCRTRKWMESCRSG